LLSDQTHTSVDIEKEITYIGITHTFQYVVFLRQVKQEILKDREGDMDGGSTYVSR
jgi:hypothetical protein